MPELKTKEIKAEVKTDDALHTKRGPKLTESAKLTIVDMGNGCWTHHHFTSQIQTRQYRSPETIIGYPYDASADIWSFACMIFESLTGDFLFEPRKGYYYDKDDDHLAQMVELLGPCPKAMALAGKHSRRFFDKTGHLRKIRGLNYWPLERVLQEKYHFKRDEAVPLADFLMKCLTWYPERRATAQELLDHPWLVRHREEQVKMSDEEYEAMMAKIKDGEQKKKLAEVLKKKEEKDSFSECAESDEELNGADVESVGSDESDRSLGTGGDERGVDLFAPGYGKGKALTNSFEGPYANMDHIHTDRGANPQFIGLV